MQCLHPFCPVKAASITWKDVIEHPKLNIKAKIHADVIAAMVADFGTLSTTPVAKPLPKITAMQKRMLLRLCPCLFNQVDENASPRGVVHLCEVTLGTGITPENVNDAFLIQYPGKGPPFAFPPYRECKDGGTVMEMLCSEVLASEGIPAMEIGDDGWPVWKMPGHILLNEGKMNTLRAFGDIMIPCAPTNLVISVKSEAARERLLYSANSIEAIGFGFFNQPDEFWTKSRMALYKRMGFSAIYMPDDTHAALMKYIVLKKAESHSVNINGTDLYRPFARFGKDMAQITGKSSLGL